MRILILDIDSLRPDHLGCYGYHRATSPNIDSIAREGVRFTNCYTSDAPCLPSRTAFITGMPGIHSGVVNHGGTASEPFRVGPTRGFATSRDRWPLFECFSRGAKWHTACISPFPGRHSAWHFLAGVKEFHSPPRDGNEIAPEVNAIAEPWLEANAKKDNWLLHLNYWDPHRPYRTPLEYGFPFAADPPPAWMTEEIRSKHWNGSGMQCAQDPNDGTARSTTPGRMPQTISSMEDYRKWIDGYDTGIRYADDHIGKLFAILKAQGVWDDTAIIITADHGENQGELNYYGAHRSGDQATMNIPLIVRWPGVAQAGGVNRGLYYNYDLSATLVDLVGVSKPAQWQGQSFASTINDPRDSGRNFLVVSQMACMAQRSVRFGPWLLIRTWHDGFSLFPKHMLFNVENDPHELNDLAEQRPDVVAEGLIKLKQWHDKMMACHPAPDPVDPMETVLHEGPLHVNAATRAAYCERLRATGRAHLAERIERNKGLVTA